MESIAAVTISALSALGKVDFFQTTQSLIGQVDSTFLRGVMRAGNSTNRKHCDWFVALPEEENSPTRHPTWPRQIIRHRPISTLRVGPVYARVNIMRYNTTSTRTKGQLAWPYVVHYIL